MRFIGKTIAFVSGIAAGIYVAMVYEDEMDDLNRYYCKTKRKMKHSIKAMIQFFD